MPAVPIRHLCTGARTTDYDDESRARLHSRILHQPRHTKRLSLEELRSCFILRHTHSLFPRMVQRMRRHLDRHSELDSYLLSVYPDDLCERWEQLETPHQAASAF
ncbi:hypothetical protein [Cynomolgus macaque cytomegalovirus strain Mauritius]|uniref:Uncharacterized protein n=1 Tax=Cynomolgus macaque cytomegalovirus strain Mauritius TaxID=1690255 RepID=A0A0K1H0C4_9BETA|nr:hypothetical protein [Cynomolgus macaque cytomegalovirus strain Mauritius]AXG21933.1 hypothetical protein [synthetic construct]AXG22202.1 hypothetical protein [synthetic construct]